MRYAELVFLVLLIAYHAVLLIPRSRRPFSSNYLIFLAGMALAWNLGLEGLRWQTIPPLVLLLTDLAVLAATFATLRGRPLPARFLTFLWKVIRPVFAFAGLALAVGSAFLAVEFPLPEVALTGGLKPAYREVRFPAQGTNPSVALKVWYPASGDLRTRPRPGSEPDSWHRVREAGGPPVFWQAYREHLPSSLIRGGRVADPGTKYAVVYAALPEGQSAEDFGYLWEDLASRGFVVVAAGPLPGPTPATEEFRWEGVFGDLLEPLRNPAVLAEPDLRLGRESRPTDYQWLEPAHQALRQLDAEPGDPFFEAVDWKRQALWAWGPGISPDPALIRTLGLRAAVLAGGRETAPGTPMIPELRIVQGGVTKADPNRWYLSAASLQRADLSDAAYLKPFLEWEAAKSQADARLHGVLRQYQAAFYQTLLWEQSASFGEAVPAVPGLILTGR